MRWSSSGERGPAAAVAAASRPAAVARPGAASGPVVVPGPVAASLPVGVSFSAMGSPIVRSRAGAAPIVGRCGQDRPPGAAARRPGPPGTGDGRPGGPRPRVRASVREDTSSRDATRGIGRGAAARLRSPSCRISASPNRKCGAGGAGERREVRGRGADGGLGPLVFLSWRSVLRPLADDVSERREDPASARTTRTGAPIRDECQGDRRSRVR